MGEWYLPSRIGIRSFVGCLKTCNDLGELGCRVWHVSVLQIALPFPMLIVLMPTLGRCGTTGEGRCTDVEGCNYAYMVCMHCMKTVVYCNYAYTSVHIP